MRPAAPKALHLPHQPVSRHVGAQDALVVTIARFHAGTTHNVIPDTAELMGTVRSFDPELRQRAPKLIERVIKGVCEAHGATYDLKYEFGYRPLINTDWVADILRDVALKEVGEEHFQVSKPTMGGEDFSAYLEKAPGAYFNVGSGSDDCDSKWPHHHPRFTLDESALVVGVRMLQAAALDLAQPLTGPA